VSDASAPRPAAESTSNLIRWMGVQDANNAGYVHGGVVMKTCDEAAAIAAIRHSGCRVVTAGVDRMVFTKPINPGELLNCSARSTPPGERRWRLASGSRPKIPAAEILDQRDAGSG